VVTDSIDAPDPVTLTLSLRDPFAAAYVLNPSVVSALFRCFEVDGGYCGVGTCVINVNERSIIRR